MISVFNKFILGAYFIITFCACGNFLEEVSQDEFEPETTDAYSELLNGAGYAFAELDGLTWYMDDDIDGVSSYSYTDVYNACRDIFTWQYYMYQSLKDANVTDATYENYYEKIMVCNVIIDDIEMSVGTESQINMVLGEALTLRAYYYLQLVNIFATPYNDSRSTPDQRLGVSLVTKSEIRDEGIARSSVADVYKQITADIERAVSLLDQNKTNNGVYRINYVSAHLIASRIYLYMEEWDKVIEHATQALAGAPDLVYLPTYAYTNVNYPTNSTNPVVSSSFPETIFVFGSMPGRMGFMGTPVCLSTDLVSSFSEPNDSRNGMYFKVTASGYIYPYQEYKHGVAERGYVWRTAELYLNRAEAYMEKYKAGAAECGQLAVNDLNKLRENRFTNYSNYTLSTADDLENLCKLERRRELFMEGHRWFDLRRYGMPRIEHTWVSENGQRTTYVLQEKDPGYTLPISQDVLDRNSKLVQNELATDRIGTN